MPTPSLRSSKRWIPSLLTRGESIAGGLGLAITTTLVACMAGAGWWTLEIERANARATVRQACESTAASLAGVAAAAVAADDFPRLRSMLVEVAAVANLNELAVRLPDGSLIASSDPKASTLAKLPASFGTFDPRQEIATMPGFVSGAHAAQADARGEVVVHATRAVEAPGLLGSDMLAGLGGICVAGLLGVGLVYRRARRRLSGVAYVRGALLTLTPELENLEAALIGGAQGPEVAAWNRLVQRTLELRREDLSERTAQALAAHRAGDPLLAAMFDALPSGVMIVDVAGRIAQANGAAGVMLGVKRDEMALAPVGKFIKQREVLSLIETALAGQHRQKRSIEVRLSAPGATSGGALGPIGPGAAGHEGGVIRATVRSLRQEDGGGAMVVLEDVTQQRVADEARNAFVASATHELRTPLTNMRLYIDTLLEPEGVDDAHRARALNVINQESRRLERLISDMLSVSEMEAGSVSIKRDDVRLDQLMDELYADFAAQGKDKEIDLRFELPPKLPVIHADRDKLTLALQNLLGNALKYTPQGGKVAVRLTYDQSVLRVDVEDTGIGVRPEECELIFEKFYRAKDKRLSAIAGTGLGLPMSRQIARLHGGDVTLRSELDKGSTFTLTIPISTPIARAA
ncbi:MAG: ATP-binding protein [Planctomycetota bacterium]|nr:ATP-binding protein [Planctomycetota bacterium]